MRVLGFGTYDAAKHPRVGILLAGLRAHGFDVSECNRPLDLDTAARVAILRHPWRLPILVGKLGVRWWALIRDSRRSRDVEIVLVGYLGLFDVLLARRLFPRATIVLDHLIGAAETAVDRNATARPIMALLRWLDRTAIAAADILLVDTEEHRALVTDVRPDRESAVLVVALGATEDWFAAARAALGTVTPATLEPAQTAGGASAPSAAHPPLRVVFFGLFTPLQGTPIIGAALAELARRGSPITATMIGFGQDLDTARRAAGPADVPDRTTWVPWVEPAELPAVVAAHDVCLGIFGSQAKALRVVPNKVYQGVAAGCVVVTSDTKPQRRVVGEVAVLVPPGDPGALADALADLDQNPAEVIRLRRATEAFAESTMTPAVVTSALAETLRRVR